MSNNHDKAIEAAARAFCLEADLDPDWAGYEENKAAWQMHAHGIRAAIAAFLEAVEPSEVMMLAHAGGADPMFVDRDKEISAAVWRAMSKALAEELKRP